MTRGTTALGDSAAARDVADALAAVGMHSRDDSDASPAAAARHVPGGGGGGEGGGSLRSRSILAGGGARIRGGGLGGSVRSGPIDVDEMSDSCGMSNSTTTTNGGPRRRGDGAMLLALVMKPDDETPSLRELPWPPSPPPPREPDRVEVEGEEGTGEFCSFVAATERCQSPPECGDAADARGREGGKNAGVSVGGGRCEGTDRSPRREGAAAASSSPEKSLLVRVLIDVFSCAVSCGAAPSDAAVAVTAKKDGGGVKRESSGATMTTATASLSSSWSGDAGKEHQQRRRKRAQYQAQLRRLGRSVSTGGEPSGSVIVTTPFGFDPHDDDYDEKKFGGRGVGGGGRRRRSSLDPPAAAESKFGSISRSALARAVADAMACAHRRSEDDDGPGLRSGRGDVRTPATMVHACWLDDRATAT